MEIFPGARDDGSVSLDEIQQKISDSGGLIKIADMIIGSVAIRKYVENDGYRITW